MLQTIAIGIQTLPKTLKNDYLYVDKTEYAYRFATGYPCVFISRPRRFGKSLMVSTLAEVFRGNKELFKGLWIYDKLDWTQYDYPVLRFDLSMAETYKVTLYESIEEQIAIAAQQYGVTLESDGIGATFRELIMKTAAGSRTGQVVVLIDEYDAPITNYTDKPEQQETHANVLRSFYGILKGMDAYLRQVFITGITRYAQLALFSSLNNITDLTTNEAFLAAFGYTQTELETNFAAHLDAMAVRFGYTKPELLEDIKYWYNGYSWDGTTRVYNPYGFANFLVEKQFGSYWVQTGSARALRDALRANGILPENMDGFKADRSILDHIDYNHAGGISLLFQTGYLTIQSAKRSDFEMRYTLGIPNEEVRRVVNDAALVSFLSGPTTDAEKDKEAIREANVLVYELREALETGDVPTVIDILKVFLAALPYQLSPRREAFWHSVIHTALYAAVQRTYSEVSSSKGRADTLVHTEDFIYIFEYKTTGTAAAALDQIKHSNYAEPHRREGKTIFAVGVRFDEPTRSITEWICEELDAADMP